ncbi:ANGE2-like protein [Mya arenaria]|uniref:ANGE2-like protein n=1 Tax=Mya arenaria TaxID=6604 RepID=A0ABY7FEY3_MYAAR|nr:protein angel homolog 2-like [Mya arenaria]XP_052766900.1 protein angel homolog 2-like [Mya arenaria]XP_052766901.1 protein angel homolog 2-like [Mya arenaria]XP_052766902.1 protein angel homolog 2-like [Mya arenaria]WAR19516.1 ANGE2-like protein [Mya arenaria]
MMVPRSVQRSKKPVPLSTKYSEKDGCEKREVSSDIKVTEPESCHKETVSNLCSISGTCKLNVTPVAESSGEKIDISLENNESDASRSDAVINNDYGETIQSSGNAGTNNVTQIENQLNLYKAIQSQSNVPFVNVGPLSHSNHVPVYQRSPSRPQKMASSKPTPETVYSGLSWQPNGSKRKRNNSAPYDDYHGRRWEYTEIGHYYLQRPAHQRGFEFTIMSYNVLAQNLLQDNRRMYNYCRQQFLEWEFRRERLLEELRFLLPDVICLQEVHGDHYVNFFTPELHKLGYQGQYIKRTGDKQEGCATFYRTQKFTLLEVVHLPYQRTRQEVLNRENVALIVKLKPLGNCVPQDRTLVVANTHLLFNPKRGDIKLAQLILLLAEVDKCAHFVNSKGKNDYQALVVCGDFNSTPHSEIYKFLQMGFLEYQNLRIKDMSGQEEGMMKPGNQRLASDFFPREMGISDNCQYCDVVQRRNANTQNVETLQSTPVQSSGFLQHGLRLHSAYDHWTKRWGYFYPEITTHHGNAVCTVDYIFYGIQSALVRFARGEVQTSSVKESHLFLLAKYGLLTERELNNMGSLPNRNFGSDHLALMSEFLLT